MIHGEFKAVFKVIYFSNSRISSASISLFAKIVTNNETTYDEAVKLCQNINLTLITNKQEIINSAHNCTILVNQTQILLPSTNIKSIIPSFITILPITSKITSTISSTTKTITLTTDSSTTYANRSLSMNFKTI